MRLALAVLIVLMFAGCVEEEPQSYQWSGAFTAERTNEDLQEFSQFASKHGDVAILESFPEQFVISRLDAGGCQFLQPFIESRDYIASHSGCREVPLQP